MFKKFKWFLLLIISASNFPLAVTIDGYAYLEDQSDHSGITVTFERTAPSSLTEEAVTDENGFFSLNVEVGVYNIFYNFDEYYSFSLNEVSLFSNTTLNPITLEKHYTFKIVPESFSTIQAAVDSSWSGDTILVMPGTYNENISIQNINITLVSNYFLDQDTNNVINTIIDGGSNARAINFSGLDTTSLFSGFTIRNGNSWPGGGGGVNVHQSSLRMNNLIIEDNQCGDGGGGIRLNYSDDVIISDVIIRNNSANNNGGGLYTNRSNNVKMSGVEISNNIGSGIYSNSSYLIVKNTIIKNNNAEWGAGGGIWTNGNDYFENVVIIGNYATYRGGGVSTSQNPHFKNVIIANNETDGNGAGLFAGFNGTSNPTIENSIIYNNDGDFNIYIERNEITISHSNIYNIDGNNFFGVGDWIGNNVLTNINNHSCDLYYNIQLDPLFVNPSGGNYNLQETSPCIDAGDPSSDYDPDGSIADMGAYPSSFGTPIPITLNVPGEYTSIQSALNAAGTGDTILVQPGTYTENIFWPETNGIKLISAGDSSNTIIDGGGVSSVVYVKPFDAVLDTNSLINGFKIQNGLSNNGGGIYINGAGFKITNCLFSNNIASEPSHGGTGGGIFVDNGTIILESSKINFNSAKKYGGGVYINDSYGSIIKSSTISENTLRDDYAGDQGGVALFINNSENIKINNIDIQNNEYSSYLQSFVNYGGAIRVDGCNGDSISFKKVRLIKNTIDHVSAVDINNSSSVYFSESIIGFNIIPNSIEKFSITGGGNWSNCFIVYNQGNGIDGGNISNSTIIGNNLGIANANANNLTIINNNIGAESSISQSNILGNGAGVNGINYVAENNYWGDSSGPFHISQNPNGIGDSVEQGVDVDPWLTAPNTDAPPIPAQNVTITSTGNDFISLTWDASELGDLSGYKLYFDTDSSGYPYANSIDVGNITSYTLSELSLGTTYYLAVTTYDTDGNESWFSNEVSGVTRVLEVQNINIGVNENRMHIIDHSPMISFDYYDSMGEEQTSYQIQVSADSLSITPGDIWESGIVSSDTTNVQYAGNELIDGNMYYLRVRAASGDFWSNWSYLSFRMNSKPTVPILVSPINNQVTTTPTILSVLNSMDAEEDNILYSFFVYEDASMETRLDSALGIASGQDTTSWQVVASLPDNGQYYWYASSFDGYESSSSQASSFLLNVVNDIPAEFSLVNPSDSIDVTTQLPILDWEVAFDPDPLDTVRYKLYLDTPEPGVVIVHTDTSTNFQIQEPLQDNTTYYWKVVAMDLSGATTENAGGYHSFRVNTENDLPSDFALLTPENTSMVTDLTPTLRWDIPTDADDRSRSIVSYHVYLDTNLTNVIPDTVTTNSYTPEVDLIEDAMYSWKVIAVDNDGGIKESSTWSFWTNSENSSPTQVTLLTPSSEEETGLLPTFSWTASSDADLYDEITYTISYGLDVSMLNSVDVGSDLIYTPDNDLQDNTTYYWKVVATDLSGATFTTPMQSFRVNSTNDNPDVFSLVSPDSSGVINTLHTLLVWSPTSDLDGDSITFEVYIGNEMIGITEHNYFMISDLIEDSTYTWHVKAYDNNQGMSETAPWSFTTNSENSPPAEFSLVDPLDNAVLNIFNPPFCWEETTDPDFGDTITYAISLGKHLDSMSVIYVGPHMESCFYETMGMVEDNTTYYWNVVASDDAGAVIVSNIQTFTINTQNDSPGLATLIAPLQGSIQTDIRPSFYWSEAHDPDPFDHVTYSIEWWPVNETDVMFIEDVDTNTFTPEYDLSDNSKFGWRVTAKDIEGLSSMTDSSYFFTDAFPEPPLAFNTVYPENNAEGLGTSIDFVWNKTIDPDPLDEVTYQLVYGTDWQDSSTYVYSDITTDTSTSVLLDDNIQYYWIVVARDADGFIVGSNNDTPNMVTVGTLSVDNNTVPTVFALHQNYPNPFNPTTKISYDLPKQSLVTLSIYDLMGRKVRTLVNSEQTIGFKNIQWNATNDNGQPVPAGMYIYTIQAGEYRQTKKMVLLK